MLSLKQVQAICMVGQAEEQCRYLAADDTNSKYYCVKKTAFKNQINNEIDLFVEKMKEVNIDPESKGIPLGDNCSGYIFLKHKMQGIDVKNS